jgi:hypothetical protein
MMHPYQQAAYEAMRLFVAKEGGEIESIKRSGQSYFWTSGDGEVSRIAWEEPAFERAAVGPRGGVS